MPGPGPLWSSPKVLNRGETRNALARAVSLSRLGTIRDIRFENQKCRASALNPVTAAIVLWDTVDLERAVQALRDAGVDVDRKLMPHVSPPGWDQLGPTGDYVWPHNRRLEPGAFRPRRRLGEALRT